MSRVQLALNVDDLDEAVSFYAKLFGAEPAKLRPGYANFAIAEPPLKLVLLENPGQGGSLNHLGVEVPDTAAVDAAHARLAEAWVQGAPNGERWEIYTVLEDSPTFWGEDGGQSWQTVEATLDAGQAGQAPQCCGGQQASDPSQAGACCP
jgi:lactoylglutathione lyase